DRAIQPTHNTVQILQARGHALGRRNLCFSKLHILLHYRPSRVPIFRKRTEERSEVDMALADNRKYLVLDRFFECPLITARELQHWCIAVFYMHETQFVLILLRLFDRVALAINAVSSVEAESDAGV